MLILAKNVRSGDLVALRGVKFVRCGKRMRPYGVYQAAYTQTILTDIGIQTFECPDGIVQRGPVLVKAAVPKKR